MSELAEKLRGVRSNGRSASSLLFLSDLGREDRDTLREEWPRLAAEERHAIVSRLATMAEDNIELDFRHVFLVALEDADPKVRLAAIEGLYEDESKLLLSRLLNMLRIDPDEGVRAASAIALSRFTYLAECAKLGDRSSRLRDTLVESARDSSEAADVRRRSVESLGYLDGDPEVQDLIRASYARGGKQAESAVFAMGRSMDEKWAPVIIHELQNAHPAMCYEAARAAGELALEEALPALVKMSSGPDLEVKLAAIWSLGQIGGKVAIEALQKAGRSKQEVVREAAEEALSELRFNADPLGNL